MSKAKARVFVPLTKVDEDQRLVYGTITQQVLDKSGEMMDYTKSKPHFEKWSNDIHTASGGLSKGNLRVMHGLTVAGKLTELEFNDEDQSIEVCSKVVDDNEWQKVLEGCYTGFSVGGKYGKRWNETIDGSVIKKYEAMPTEVSLVDNPCVPSATFSLVKADGHEEEVMFKVAAAAAAQVEPGEDPSETGDTPAEVREPASTSEVETPPASVEKTVTNAELAARATELAKVANDGSDWMAHIEAARTELTKGDTNLSVAAAADKEAKADEASAPAEGEEAETKPAAEDADDETAGEDNPCPKPVEKVTPLGIKQRWIASDGTPFVKKADAEAHEVTLVKAEPVELTDAQKLAARLAKALDPAGGEDKEPELPLMEDLDRLSKAVQAIITPFDEDGQPKLEKGMYTVNRFSNVLSDMASLSRTIKTEGTKEGEESDKTIAADIIGAVKSLGTSFIAYAADQVTELLAGIDDDTVVVYHDYYYNVATVDPENGLAKDVCSLITDLREPAKEKREELAKSFGFEDLTTDDELSPPMQKRFDQLVADNEELKKVASDAVTQVENLAKRMQVIENTPMPRAPNGGVALKEGDGMFLGKSATTEEEKLAVLNDMLKVHGPEGMATMMIKASQATGGQKLTLKS